MNSNTDQGKAGLDGMVRELIGVLESHVERHRDLSKVMERKRDALVKLDTDALETVLQSEKETIGRIGEIEQNRLALTGRIAGEIGSPAGRAMRLAELVGHVDDVARDELLELREEIRDMADRLDRTNRLNRTMTLQTLDHYHFYVSMLAGRDPEAKTYGKKGIEEGGASPLILDRKI